MPSTCPASIEYIGVHAAQPSDPIAVIFEGREIRYKDLYASTGQMISLLKAQGLKPGQTAAIEDGNLVLHLLVLLACDAMGVATLSFIRSDLDVLRGPLRQFDWLLAYDDPGIADVPFLWLGDQSWNDALGAATPVLPILSEDQDPSSPVRIVMSSGTSAEKKLMVQSRAVHEARLSIGRIHNIYSTETRFLALYNLSLEAVFRKALNILRAGGCLIRDTNSTSFQEILSKNRVTDILTLPHNLDQMIGELSQRPGLVEKIHVHNIGGAASAQKRALAERHFAKTFTETFGTNETGTICWIHRPGEGTVMPGVTVEVVDETDKPVFNTLGRLRIKGDGVIDGYWRDAGASQQAFRDG
ncbi:MAG: AMP-binding protein [Rhodospirillaceae bacterium]